MLKRFGFFILLCCMLTTVFAADKTVFGPVPSWLVVTNPDLQKQPNKKEVNNGLYTVLLDEQEHLGTAERYCHLIRHIANTSGVQEGSEVSVTFAPEYETVIFHYVRIMRNGQEVYTVKPGQIKVIQEETNSADFQYNGLKRAYALLEDVRKGDEIDFSYTVKGANPVFAGKWDRVNFLVGQTAICNYFYTVLAPASRTLYIKYYNDAPEATTKAMPGGGTIYQWKNPPITLFDYENSVPGWYLPYGYMILSEYNSWQEVVKWGLNVFGNYTQPLPKALLTKMDEWEKEADGDREKFMVLATRFVQDQVRYQGLEIGENSHKPHTPEQVFQRRFGDCKDKALLLVRIFQTKNINAYVALVNTQWRNELGKVQPAPGMFNHAIVAVEDGGDYKFIDPTLSYQRGYFNDLYTPPYGKALVLKEKAYQLHSVKPTTSGYIDITEVFTVSLKGKGSTALKTVAQYHGHTANAIRQQQAIVASRDLEKSFLEYYQKTYPKISATDDPDIEDDSVRNLVTITEQYEIEDLWDKNKDETDYFSVGARPVYERVPDPKGHKDGMPLVLPYPVKMDYVIELHMPSNWPFEEKGFSYRTDAFSFSFTPETYNGVVRLRYHYETFKDNIPAGDIAEYRRVYPKMLDVMEFQFMHNAGMVSSLEKMQNGSIAGRTNWFMILLGAALAALLTWGVVKLNKRSDLVEYTPETGWPLGGWTVVLGVSLCISMIVQLVRLSTGNYFSKDWWIVTIQAGKPLLGYLIIAEFVLNLVLTALLAGIIYWYFKRRDIFPAMFKVYVIALVSLNLVLVVLYNLSNTPAIIELTQECFKNLIRNVIYAAIWLSYILKSQRVRATFLLPYNYAPGYDATLPGEAPVSGQEAEEMH